MDNIKLANKIIKDGLALLPDEAKTAWKAPASDVFVNEAIDAALNSLDSEVVCTETFPLHSEKESMLEAFSVQEANRMASTLWRLELLTDDIEKEYRKLPAMEELADAYNLFVTARKARMDKVMEQHREIAEEEKALDIFKGIINGIPADESEKRYEEYQKQQQAAMGGGR